MPQTTTSTRTQQPTRSRASETRCLPERTRTGPRRASRTPPRHWKSISVRLVILLEPESTNANASESLRYLDQYPSLHDDAPPSQKEEFDELRTVLLINSALGALRSQPPDPTLAVHQTTRAYTLAAKIEHKGWSHPLHGPVCVFTRNPPQRRHSTAEHSQRRP